MLVVVFAPHLGMESVLVLGTDGVGEMLNIATSHNFYYNNVLYRRVYWVTTMTMKKKSRWSWWRMTLRFCVATEESGTNCPPSGS